MERRGAARAPLGAAPPPRRAEDGRFVSDAVLVVAAAHQARTSTSSTS
jgi:hypothetical protein